MEFQHLLHKAYVLNGETEPNNLECDDYSNSD